jgi:hypothetical protein
VLAERLREFPALTAARLLAEIRAAGPSQLAFFNSPS